MGVKTIANSHADDRTAKSTMTAFFRLLLLVDTALDDDNVKEEHS